MSGWSRENKFALYGAFIATATLGLALLDSPRFRQLAGFFGTSPSIPQELRTNPVTPPVQPEQALTTPSRVWTEVPADGSGSSAPPARGWDEVSATTVSASSILPPSRVANYEPENVLDGRWSTVWVEDAPGSGTGEWIEISLGQTRTIARIGVVNGYGKGPRYRENGRVRTAILTFSDGSIQQISLRDESDLQYISVQPVATSFVRLTIQSAYPGSRWDDTAIGEIRLWSPQ